MVFEKFIEANVKVQRILLTVDPWEGLELAYSYLPDVVLMDFQMPEINGIELCRLMKKKTELKDVPILLITGTLVTSELKAKGLNAGAFDFLVKPIEMTEFAAKIGVVLRTKQLEDDLRRTNMLLENEIIERKNSEREMMIAKKKAEISQNQMKEFLSFVTHEMRTPIHHVINYAYFGVEKTGQESTEKIKNYFQIIHKCTSELDDLLSNLLDLSKSEAGKMEYQMRVSDLRLVIDDCLTQFQSSLDQFHLNLHYTRPKDQVVVECDFQKIKQVLTNLLSNAVKNTPEGKIIKIELDTIPSNLLPEPQGTEPAIRITVENEGPEIPAQYIKSIFDKFVSRSNGIRNHIGTGLGLAISREIVKAHQGQIWAENRSGSGVAFTFVIPEKQSALDHSV